MICLKSFITTVTFVCVAVWSIGSAKAESCSTADVVYGQSNNQTYTEQHLSVNIDREIIPIILTQYVKYDVIAAGITVEHCCTPPGGRRNCTTATCPTSTYTDYCNNGSPS